MDYALLNRFYGDHVQMNKVETARNIKQVMRIVRKILDHVHKKDRRFKRKPLRVGSYYTHLKVSKADEFDFSVVLDVPPLDWCNDDSSYIYEFNKKDQLVKKVSTAADLPIEKGLISLPDNIIQQWNRDGINDDEACLTFDDDIIPIMVKKRFKALVSEAVNELDIENVDAKRLTDSPATTLTINLTKPANGDVSVDLTPLIESRSTFVEFLGWPRPGSQWPPKKKVDEIKEMGFNDIAKDKYYWTYSFASCEKKLLDGIDNIEENPTFRKMSEKIMKKLKEKWCPKSMKQELTSYHLLNILFWECERYPQDSEWSEDHVDTKLISMSERLLECIRKNNLPQYFHPRVNLFSTKKIDVLNQVAKNIQQFLRKPVSYIQRYY
ncbi:unnamed protein product [Mytilus edulis]|uniref:Uncharacterized protein n=1 Tax=Mytilus edulis TaxID=6550 RepID=A0A8S3PP17_MYTED|nr:unnamed protein product [Mytilus edulis]